MGKNFVYVGSFDLAEKGGGIGLYKYDAENGTAEYIKTMHEEIIAGLMCIDEKNNILYSLDERRENPARGEKGGRVYAFSIDPDSGELSELNWQPAFGTMPTYLTADREFKFLLMCHHSSPNWVTKAVKDPDGTYRMEVLNNDCGIVLYPIEEDGRIGAACDIMLFPQEDGVDPCFHSIEISPDGRYFAACSRNQAKIHLMKIDYEKRRLLLCDTLCFPRGEAPPKDGHCPRYGAFHPTRPIYYFNSEFKPCITAVKYENERLKTLAIQNVSPDAELISQDYYTMSDLCVSGDGKYLYALYRLINVVCSFSIAEDDGTLSMIQSLKLDGSGPRGLKLSPDGRFLLVANLVSKDLSSFAVGEDGTLSPVCRTFGQEYPGNIAFYCK